MSRIIIISNPPPQPHGLVSTMNDNAVASLEFEVRYSGEDLSIADQASLLRRAADQLDPPAGETSETTDPVEA